jgi:hypothetical protein
VALKSIKPKFCGHILRGKSSDLVGYFEKQEGCPKTREKLFESTQT